MADRIGTKIAAKAAYRDDVVIIMWLKSIGCYLNTTVAAQAAREDAGAPSTHLDDAAAVGHRPHLQHPRRLDPGTVAEKQLSVGR